MQNPLTKLLEPKTNGFEITCLLVNILKIKVSNSSLKKSLEEHPNYPSLLSISDVLTSYGVENLSISIDINKIAEVPTPFITQIKEKAYNDFYFFTVVKKINNNMIHYFEPEKHIWILKSREDFLSRCSGNILLSEAQENAGEKEYESKVKEEKRRHLIQNLMAYWLPAVLLTAGIVAFLQFGIAALLPFLFSISTLIGAVTCILLIWYELDQHNWALQQICGASKKVDCGAILQSKASKIIGISWSTIGSTYFIGSILLQIFLGIINKESLFICSWLNLFALPYTFFSLYYQWKIAKQWCMLCLFVQSLLIMQFIISTTGGWHTLLSLNTLAPELFVQVFTAFAIPFMVINILVPIIFKSKERNNIYNELQKLKHNPTVFNAMLQTQEVAKASEGLGIILGNPDATYKVIKVCNPYCGPCARAHQPIEELLQNNPDIQVQIIFTVSNDETDYRNEIIKHLLAINEVSDESISKKSLHDWYLAETKNYEAFSIKYPLNGEVNRQQDKIKAMKTWCEDTGIEFTPTFFISSPSDNGSVTNYHKLPEIYSISDLKYFFSV